MLVTSRLAGTPALAPRGAVPGGLLVFALVLPPGLAARQAEPLTLARVLTAVDSGHPAVEAMRAEARAAWHRVPATGRPPDPAIQFGLMNRDLPGFGLNDPLGMTQVQVMQMIPWPGKLGASRAVAAASAAARDAEAEEARRAARARAAMAFIELAGAGRRLRLAREGVAIAEEVARAARTRYAVGDDEQASVMRARVEVVRMREDVVRMEGMQDRARARLAAELGWSGATLPDSVVFPALPAVVPALAELSAGADSGRPMLRAAAAETAGAAAAQRLAARELFPDLEVGVVYGQRPMAGGTERMVSFMAGVTVPVFAGSRQLRMQDEARAMRDAALLRVEALRRETRAAIGAARARYEEYRRLGDLSRASFLPEVEAAAASARAAYLTGRLEFMAVIESVTAVIRAEEALAGYDTEALGALAELEMLTGRDLLAAEPAAGLPGGDR